ncbi:recombinase family protein [Desulfosporosinus sp. HMP52]|uniref:recombinase family protein n=1 Tax=Desulfosporosinus sp. HMP52 TaxID=1487923 RepID=UPI00068A4CD8|nr:recombinase family protein [Desulfosporosinus sp. HMP52]
MSTRKVIEIPRQQNPFLKPLKLRTCAYVRVSTEHVGQLNSLQNQTDYYEHQIRANPDYEYSGIYSDSGISGAKEERPGFQAMLKAAKAGDLDLILTKSISRFSRDTVTLLQSIRELKEAGVAVLFEEQSIHTLSAEGELMLSVLGAIAEEERKSVCSNVQWAMRNKFKAGEVMVDTNRLLGYDKDNHGNLVVNEEQADIVRQIYRLYLEGMSAYRIAQVLNEQSVPTYAQKEWKSSRVISIISNEKYQGDCLLQKNYIAEDGKQRINRGQKEQYYVRNNHPGIVSRQDWEAAQAIREGRKTKFSPLTGRLKCPYCSASLIRVVHEGRWVSWICATYMQKGKSVCRGMRISDKTLQGLTRDIPITEAMVVEEMRNESPKKRSEKNYRLIPAVEYDRAKGRR